MLPADALLCRAAVNETRVSFTIPAPSVQPSAPWHVVLPKGEASVPRLGPGYRTPARKTSQGPPGNPSIPPAHRTISERTDLCPGAVLGTWTLMPTSTTLGSKLGQGSQETHH